MRYLMRKNQNSFLRKVVVSNLDYCLKIFHKDITKYKHQKYGKTIQVNIK